MYVEIEAKREERLRKRVKGGKQVGGEDTSANANFFNGTCGSITLVSSDKEQEELTQMTQRFRLGLQEAVLDSGKVVPV